MHVHVPCGRVDVEGKWVAHRPNCCCFRANRSLGTILGLAQVSHDIVPPGKNLRAAWTLVFGSLSSTDVFGSLHVLRQVFRIGTNVATACFSASVSARFRGRDVDVVRLRRFVRECHGRLMWLFHWRGVEERVHHVDERIRIVVEEILSVLVQPPPIRQVEVG